MRQPSRSFVVLVVALGAAACAPNDKPATLFAPGQSLKSGGVPDTRALPDLIVDSKSTQNNWIVRVEDLPANFCSVEEGNITPGEHTLLRFTVTTPNIGQGDVFIGSPLDHYNANDGLFEFATCHQHFHFRNYAVYELIDPCLCRRVRFLLTDVPHSAPRGVEEVPNRGRAGAADRAAQHRRVVIEVRINVGCQRVEVHERWRHVQTGIR